MIASLSPRLLAFSALLGLSLTGSQALAQSSSDSYAQMPPGPPGAQAGVNPICPRLEAQLATIDRGGGGDPAREDQIRRYQDAAAKQQAELDRVSMQAKRSGCDSPGFFSIFNGRAAECQPINNQIQQMRSNLDQITGSLERLRGGGFGGERDNQRRSVLAALGQNNCGPQYQQYANANRGGGNAGGNFLTSLFGGGGETNPAASLPPPSADLAAPQGTYRTVCVRTCDGAYFPISFATVPGRFADDERACKAQCPAAEATLFTYRNPGEDMNQAVSINGQSYSALPNAFKYRTEFNPSCSCKAPGQTWAEALKSIDERASAAEQGDIIVTEESAKRMQQRQTAKPPATAAKKGAAPAEAAAPNTATADGAAGDKQIRTVGPTFIPAR
ncbi:conserved hypothetical protein; putative secreted protein [Bradyrhizobium sp. ORS 285]|uniref:DUF2865 domain-containing protein n=1 Tax=Bradyrhizobium sp. ORS 285 TaxID=115808 RepID=UPI0002407DC4|nr:DUF2865 domain-containing protein [Bradyrhizobium sp. ORS 285]CCD83822.1 conserved exported hypothetical protein [Bradyrhizobium sp. ORS 285]SMX59365.1 conserved hypothetical protein; putative secreted protein [Bradyrhizobium sp. ORS 285]